MSPFFVALNEMNDFLDNLANDQHQKMLREINNDAITPKKRDSRVQNDLYERSKDEFEDEDRNSVVLTEF